MRVLGIDPGSRVTGYGVVETQAKGLMPLTKGCVRLNNDNLATRLKQIYDELSETINAYQPDIMAIERVFISNNAKSALILGHARGSAMLAAANHDLPVAEYTALQVKSAVVGTGGAAKEQVQHMVRALLGLRENPPADAADALACAICHIHTEQVVTKLRAVEL